MRNAVTGTLFPQLFQDTDTYLNAVAVSHQPNGNIAAFSRSFGGMCRCKWKILRFLRKLKEGHQLFLDLKNLKSLKIWVRVQIKTTA